MKMINVAVIASMANLTPLASSMFTPGIEQIAEGLGTSTNAVIACTTSFLIMMGELCAHRFFTSRQSLVGIANLN